ncbi:MAG: acyltransferase, partial [Nitrospirota bacterium]|nr:acyltransferase [Nitrospirota bacterium]
MTSPFTSPQHTHSTLTSGSPSHPIRHDIQGLRALAIALVLLFHAGVPFLEGGYVGVDVFFVISGYLITRMLVREKEKHGHIHLLAFYARRIRRLLPAASVTLAFTALIIFVLYSPVEQSQFIRSLFSSVVYLSNMWFAFQTTDYLGENVHLNPYLHTWSLSVEEQFYLLWPLLILVLPFHNTPAKNVVKLILLVGFVFVLSLISSLLMGEISQPWAFFASPFRAWEFATGALAFCIDHRKRHLPGTISRLGVSAGIGAILLAGIFYDKSTPFPGLYALVPTLGTLLVLIGGHHQNWFITFSKFPWIRWLGDISYSLYLWHWPLLTIPLSLMGDLTIGERTGCVVLALLLGTLSYHYIENPIRFNQNLSRPTWKGLALGVALTIFGVSLTFTLRGLAKAELQTMEQKNILSARTLNAKVYMDGCHLNYTEIFISDCSYGNISSPKTIFLFGDSHAAQWFPALEEFSKRYNYRLVSLTKSACPSAHLTPYNKAFGRSYTECGTWQNLVLERIARERPVLVILSNSSAHIGTAKSQFPSREWMKGMRDTLAIIQESGAQAAIIRDTPSFPNDIPICLSRAVWTGAPLTKCDASVLTALDQQMFALDRQTAKSFPHVHFIDFSEILCQGDTCPAMMNGHTAYKDRHHLSLPMVLD